MTSTPLTQTTRPRPRSSPRAWAHPALCLVALYLFVAIPLILLLGPRGRPGEDQIVYHEPTIHSFAAALPRPNLGDYLSATTPGYHLALAVIERVVSGDARILQLAGAAFTAVLLALLARTVTSISGAGPIECLVLCLPFACSMYVLESGVWLLPDNAGWLTVLACLALAFRGSFDWRTVVLGGMALIGVVLMRQVHLWVAGSLWAAAWLAPGIAEPAGMRQLLTRLPARLRSLVPMVLVALPAFVILGVFFKLWGGLTPPFFQRQYQGANFASFAFLLSLLGIGSVFFAGYVLDPLIELITRNRAQCVWAAAGGVLVSALPPTTYSVAEGRWSGLWNAVRVTPVIAGHMSVLIVALSVFGALMLLAWCRALSARDRWVVLATLFGFAAAQAVVGQLWQRYNEPMVLMMLSLMGACSRRRGATWALTLRLLEPLRLGGVAGLGVLLAALSTYVISRFPPAAHYDPELINRRTTSIPDPRRHVADPPAERLLEARGR